MKLRLKTGDSVKVITGKYKGKTGKITQTFPAMNRVVVEGVNTATRHLRTGKSGEKGQKVQFFMPLNASNVLPLSEAGTPQRHHRHATSASVKKTAA